MYISKQCESKLKWKEIAGWPVKDQADQPRKEKKKKKKEQQMVRAVI